MFVRNNVAKCFRTAKNVRAHDEVMLNSQAWSTQKCHYNRGDWMMSVQYAQAQSHASSAGPENANPDWRPQQQPLNKTEVQSAPRRNNQFTLACLPRCDDSSFASRKRAEIKLKPISRADLCVTEGTIEELPWPAHQRAVRQSRVPKSQAAPWRADSGSPSRRSACSSRRNERNRDEGLRRPQASLGRRRGFRCTQLRRPSRPSF